MTGANNLCCIERSSGDVEQQCLEFFLQFRLNMPQCSHGPCPHTQTSHTSIYIFCGSCCSFKWVDTVAKVAGIRFRTKRAVAIAQNSSFLSLQDPFMSSTKLPQHCEKYITQMIIDPISALGITHGISTPLAFIVIPPPPQLNTGTLTD